MYIYLKKFLNTHLSIKWADNIFLEKSYLKCGLLLVCKYKNPIAICEKNVTLRYFHGNTLNLIE